MHKVDYQYTCKTYAAFLNTGRSLLRMAEKSEDGRLLLLQAAKVFSFFALEAYLNHVGREEVKTWNDHERSPFNNKIKAVLQVLHMEDLLDGVLLEHISALRIFRNDMAHGKTMVRTETVITKDEPNFNDMWKIFSHETITIQDVQKDYSVVKEVIELFNSKRNKPDPLVLNQGIRSYSMSMEDVK
jgi:hypothetical protein